MICSALMRGCLRVAERLPVLVRMDDMLRMPEHFEESQLKGSS